MSFFLFTTRLLGDDVESLLGEDALEPSLGVEGLEALRAHKGDDGLGDPLMEFALPCSEP